MIDLPRIAALAFMLLSQVTAGMTVFCDEGLGSQVMEFILEQCCETEVEADICSDVDECLDNHEVTEGDCGPCIDSSLVLLLQREDEQPSFCFVDAFSMLPEVPAVLLMEPATTLTLLGETTCTHAEHTVSHYARTVVLTC